MSSGGEDPFGPYSQPDRRFSSGYYPARPPFSPPRLDTTGSQGPGHGLPGFDLNNPFGTSSAASPHGAMAGASPHGAMAGASHGYSGYGGPSGYYQMPYHSGGLHIPQPTRHSTSSMSGFVGGPYASLPLNQLPPLPPNYRACGEGSSHGGHVHLTHASPSWHPATMHDEEMSSAVPRRRLNRSQFCQQIAFPDLDVASNDDSMPSVGADDNLASASSCADNTGIVGNVVALEQDEGNEDSMGSLGEGSSSEGDSVWSSGDDSSDDLYEEVYKGWEDLFGKDNPVFKGTKLVMNSSRNINKLLKKAILPAMYEESVSCTKHRREIKGS